MRMFTLANGFRHVAWFIHKNETIMLMMMMMMTTTMMHIKDFHWVALSCIDLHWLTHTDSHRLTSIWIDSVVMSSQVQAIIQNRETLTSVCKMLRKSFRKRLVGPWMSTVAPRDLKVVGTLTRDADWSSWSMFDLLCCWYRHLSKFQFLHVLFNHA